MVEKCELFLLLLGGFVRYIQYKTYLNVFIVFEKFDLIQKEMCGHLFCLLVVFIYIMTA